MIFKKTPIIIGLLAIVLLGVFALMFFGKGTHTKGMNTADRNALHAKEDEQSIPSVEVTKPIRKDIVRKISLTASIEPLYQATLYAKAAGYLKWINVDIGDWVKKGDILAELDIPEMSKEYDQVHAKLREAEANFEQAKADLELKKQTYQRIKEIWETEPGAVAEQDVDVAKANHELSKAKINHEKAKIDNSKAEMERIKVLVEYGKIIAPFDGVITERFVDPGALVQDATSDIDVSPVLKIMHVDTVRVFIDVPEPDVLSVQKGAKATLSIRSLPNRKFSGTVTRFANALNPETRTMRTLIEIPNSDRTLRAGMYGNITLNLGELKDAIAIPASALIVEKDKTFIYSVLNGKVEKKEIKTGIDDGIEVEVVEGLMGDEDIIIKGKNAVADGESVRISKSN